MSGKRPMGVGRPSSRLGRYGLGLCLVLAAMALSAPRYAAAQAPTSTERAAVLTPLARTPSRSPSLSPSSGVSDDRAELVVGVGTSVDALAAWARGLGSSDAGVRTEAFEALQRLDEESLPAIATRIAGFERVHGERAYAILNSFRHAVGSTRADDNVDIVPGILTVLAEDRSAAVVAMAERRLLLRSLEDIDHDEAGRAMMDILATSAPAWRWEAKRVVFRMGKRALPTLIRARGHASEAVREWARWGPPYLEVGSAGHAVQLEDNALVARVLTAYAEVRDMDAMPVVVSFVTHERTRIRQAARTAVERYGQNAVWQLRRVYRNELGAAASSDWSWEETAAALYRVHDEVRAAPVVAELDAGFAALAAGDENDARQRFEAALRRDPSLGAERAAVGFGALARSAAGSGDAGLALRDYRRATRLDPDAPEAAGWLAEIAFLDAEQLRARGLIDTEQYERVLVLAPSHRGAEQVVRAFGPEAGTRREGGHRRWAVGGAALLLLLAGASLVIRRRPSLEVTPHGDDDPERAPVTIA